MIHRNSPRIDLPVSLIGLGGHEYLPDGRSRGFHEDAKLALTPGEILPGFGRAKRAEVLREAYRHEISFYDVTLDSEIEALGRNLNDDPPPFPVYVQARPQGMVYSYDPGNRKMATFDLLEAEVRRNLQLAQRDSLDFFNIAFMKTAIDEDSEYLLKIASNISRLKEGNLIRFACADTFSGESTYLKQIEYGCFDSIFINFNFADDFGAKRVLPAAKDAGMAVIAREVFMKGQLFAMADDAGLDDSDQLCRTALKWVLSHPQVTTAVVGADTPAQLANSVSVLDQPDLDDVDLEILERVRRTDTFREYAANKKRQFFPD